MRLEHWIWHCLHSHCLLTHMLVWVSALSSLQYCVWVCVLSSLQYCYERQLHTCQHTVVWVCVLSSLQYCYWRQVHMTSLSAHACMSLHAIFAKLELWTAAYDQHVSTYLCESPACYLCKTGAMNSCIWPACQHILVWVSGMLSLQNWSYEQLHMTSMSAHTCVSLRHASTYLCESPACQHILVWVCVLSSLQYCSYRQLHMTVCSLLFRKGVK